MSLEKLKKWAQVCADTLVKAGLMKPGSGADEIILLQPEYKMAHSIFKVVIHIEWSANNPDFTEESQTMDLRDVRWKVLKEIATNLFPQLVDEPNAVNVWLKRWDSAAFAFSPPQ